MQREFDVVIIGAGVIGSTLAALLPALGVCAAERVALVADKLPQRTGAADAWNMRVFALSRASQRVLQACGVWDRLPPFRRHAYQRMCVWDAGGEAGGRGSIEFDCAALGEPNLGHIVDGQQLQWHCFDGASASGVSVIAAQVTSLTAGGVALSDGTALKTPLTVAADGADSRVRALLGIETAGHIYHQSALVAQVRTALPHADTAWQRFLVAGPLAFLPLSDGRCSIVWSNACEESARLAALDPDAFSAALTEASGGVLGTCELLTPIVQFPLQLQHALEYVRPGAALLGDAAHSVHPLAGQGLNIGLLDCATLADVLGARTGGDHPGDLRVLRRYERRRRGENYLAATVLDGLERLFTNGNPVLTRLRGAGLGVAARLPFVKQELARRALGLAGDIPGFLKIDRL